MENFTKNGFDRTRMEDIATSAGLAKGTLYLYFKNKEDLPSTDKRQEKEQGVQSGSTNANSSL